MIFQQLFSFIFLKKEIEEKGKKEKGGRRKEITCTRACVGLWCGVRGVKAWSYIRGCSGGRAWYKVAVVGGFFGQYNNFLFFCIALQGLAAHDTNCFHSLDFG